MKMPTFRPKQKLRATAARRTAAPSRAEEEYEEPSMKFSSAFIIVVLLHLVAVGGIFAFESIKVKQPGVASAAPEAAMAETPAAPLKAAAPAPEVKTVASTRAAAPAAPAKATAPAKTAAAAPAKAAEEPRKAQGIADSGKVHVVVKGENPHSIARKLGVSYEALVKLNGIDDPRRLQIGQKLHIPVQ